MATHAALPSWLEGWQVGVLAVGIALLAALLGVPRAAPPGPLPLPEVDRVELRRQRDADHARAVAAAGGLPVAVRAVGESVRRTGRATASLAGSGVRGAVRPQLESVDLAELRLRVKVARERHGDEPLLALRALQAELFLEALEAAALAGGGLEAAAAPSAAPTEASARSAAVTADPAPEAPGSGAPDPSARRAPRPRAAGGPRAQGTSRLPGDLEELGGDFVGRARSAGWIAPDGRRVAERDELLALFRVRWTELAGLRDVLPFTPTLDEWRVYYGLLLRLPEQGLGLPLDALVERQLRYVAALEQRDPSYPALFARGTLLARRGDLPAAAAAFRGHLERHPDGPWRLRAVNHLLAMHVGEP